MPGLLWVFKNIFYFNQGGRLKYDLVSFVKEIIESIQIGQEAKNILKFINLIYIDISDNSYKGDTWLHFTKKQQENLYIYNQFIRL